MTRATYPKRLIEVDLPIRRISAHARREKSIRHGHISTLHLWWARRPQAACRAVICAALWLDPADPECPEAFRTAAREAMLAWTSHERQKLLSTESRNRFETARLNPAGFDDDVELRGALLDFIADFSDWDNSTVREFLETSRALTQAAHEALGGEPGTRPLIVDPFAGGGSIPVEALRVGADTFASDLNPVAVLLNKVALEYIPRFGTRLADELQKWGDWVKREADKELEALYPIDKTGGLPLAYLWARTIRCEGPNCGGEIPLLRSLWLCKKSQQSVYLQFTPDAAKKRLDFKLHFRGSPVQSGTVKGGAATCPLCAYTTPKERVRAQLVEQRGGASNARLLAVVTLPPQGRGRHFRLPEAQDIAAEKRARDQLARLVSRDADRNIVPDEEIPQEKVWKNNPIRVHLYGSSLWVDLFTPRQLIALLTLKEKIANVSKNLASDPIRIPVVSLLAVAFDRLMVRCTANCIWDSTTLCIMQIFNQGQALPARWEFAEMVPLSDEGSGWVTTLEYIAKVVRHWPGAPGQGTAQAGSATKQSLPDDVADAVITDPPYYDAVPYAKLSDFFYIWLRRILVEEHPDLFVGRTAPKEEECVVDLGRKTQSGSYKDAASFTNTMRQALEESRRIAHPASIGVVVFAHKSTAGWEAQLQAILDAGWQVSASWPIDTESGNRLRAQNSAALASSIHICCRPRENPDGSVRENEIGDWRAVQRELPRRVHEWMPRLAAEGVVGADAIFACLGPALEIFSRYSRVEKTSGVQVTLKEYLLKVWEAVAKEALNMIFAGADATGFEEDARLTAMWLWTLSTAKDRDDVNSRVTIALNPDDEDENPRKAKKKKGYYLEFDAARKIAQGLGAHLEDLDHLVEAKGETARLLPVEERSKYLFGSEARQASAPTEARRAQPGLPFSGEAAGTDDPSAWEEFDASRPGETALDRVHQSMLLHAAGRTAALRRFLVGDGIGRDERFWRLAQALSALYPEKSDEKRWVDGVLARKKGLGF